MLNGTSIQYSLDAYCSLLYFRSISKGITRSLKHTWFLSDRLTGIEEALSQCVNINDDGYIRQGLKFPQASSGWKYKGMMRNTQWHTAAHKKDGAPREGVVRTRENGYWVSRATSRALQSLEGEGGSYVMAYPCWLQVLKFI